MNRSRKINQLLEDAAAAGHTVTERGHFFDIRGPKRTSPGIHLYVTDTGAFYEAHRNDIDLTLGLGIRTIDAVRKALSLEAK